MGKAAKWLKLLLTGKKEERCGPPLVSMEMRSGPSPMPPPKEKRRWSFRRSVTGTAMEQKSANVRNRHVRGHSDSDMDRRWETVAMVMATAAATDAAAAAAQAAAAVIRLTNTATEAVEEAAAIKIQSVFRSYLARKALCALKGLVKLQALIRGHLVRRQATATLRSMQAMVTAQARARIQRMRMLEESQAMPRHRQNNCRRSPLEARSHQCYEMEENIKIVEMDLGESRGSSKSRNSYSIAQAERRDHRLATYSASSTPYKREPHREASPVHSTLTDKSPRACSGHFGEYFVASKSSPPYLSTSSRNEAVDRTHLAEFHQIEGLICDRNLTLGHLIGILNDFFASLGMDKLRFKPAYNPYTEPSMEIFSFHEGLNKWVEVGNSGMFRPEMLRTMGFPEDVSVIAWGLSLERPTMILYGIDNIRDLFGPKVDFSLIKSSKICRLGWQ